MSFPPPWEFQTCISSSRAPDPFLLIHRDPGLLINVPRNWLSQGHHHPDIKTRQIYHIGAVLRWQRNRTGRPLSPPQIHWKNIERWENSTKQLLNAGRGHQAPRKAARCLWKEVEQNTKDKKRDKRVRDGDPSREGSLKRGEGSKHQKTLSPAGLWGVLESQMTI